MDEFCIIDWINYQDISGISRKVYSHLHVARPSFGGFPHASKHLHILLLVCRQTAGRRDSGTVCTLYTTPDTYGHLSVSGL